MFGTFERGRILGKLIGAWILCSFAAVGAPNVQRDVASEENYRFKKDAASLSTEFQQILPVQVDFGSLVDSITQRISGIEGNVTDLGKQLKTQLEQQLESSKESKAKLEEEISRLKMQQKEILKNVSREQKSMKEEISQLQERLKSAEGQKLQTTAESINRERKYVFIGENEADRKTWHEASLECMRRGGHLASHFTREKLNYVFSKVIPDNWETAWIGGHVNPRATSSNFKENFEWVEGGRISADDGLWYKGLPAYFRDKCMFVSRGPYRRKDGKMGPGYQADECKRLSSFLCEI